MSEELTANRNLPTELTVDGIKQLFMPGNNFEFVLQIIKITEDYSENRMCHLSDGFCYVTCLLTNLAKEKNIKRELEVFDVVKIYKEEIIILGLDRTPSLELCNVNVIGMRLLCSIGEPVAYQTYFNNDFENLKGSSKIADGQKVQNALNIADLLENFPHVPTKWILKAKVVRKPDSINFDKPFLIVKLMDENENTIEGVFFGQVALDAHKRLVYNREYLFNNGQIKNKKNSTEAFEIKFTEQSQIIPIETMKSTNEAERGGQITIRDITNNPFEGRMVTITGKVFKIKQIKKGRSIEIIDQNEDVIEIVLWEEITDEVKEGMTYVFENLKTKTYNSSISLQSNKFKTSVKKAPYQIEKQASSGKRIELKVPTNTMREIRSADTLLNVSEVLELQVTEKLFKDVYGYLTISTSYMETKNFFKVECPKCSSKEISANPLVCKSCSCTEPIVRWNMRCHLMGEKEDIKCVMNEELCQRLFNMSSVEGFQKLIEDPEGMKKKMSEVSHLEGMFKIKLNPSKDNVYYNILEIYRNDSLILLQKVKKEFNTVRTKYTGE